MACAVLPEYCDSPAFELAAIQKLRNVLKDNEIHDLLFQRFYERRREGMIEFGASNFDNTLSDSDVAHVSDQLLEHGLIRGQFMGGMSECLVSVMGKITADGVEVEKTRASQIAIQFVEHRNIGISSSHNVAIGNSNSQITSVQFEKLIAPIDGSSASDGQNTEAKSKLRTS